MTSEVFVSGFGVFSAFGFGEKVLTDGVFAGVHAFRIVNRFDTSRCRTDQAATYEPSPPESGGPTAAGVLTTCARQAIDMAGWSSAATLPLVVGSKVRAPSLEPESPAALTNRVADELGLGTPRRTFVNACCAGANAIIHAAQLIRAGRSTAVLAGGAFLVDRQAFSLFDSTLALASDGRLRPFDRDRKGVLLGDGGAILLLESGESVRARSVSPLAQIAGWAVTDDAFHVAQPEPEGRGTAAAVRQALTQGEIGPERLAYVNAHGTGTVLNDSAEASALHAALGPSARDVFVSSTKSTTGHALEASGALETVITLLAMRSSVLPPTAGLREADGRNPLRHVRVPTPAEVPFALNLNSSVGGVNTAILLRAPR